VSELELAPLDEKLFSSYGVDGSDEAAFKEEVAANMQRELRKSVDSVVKQQVMDAILAAHPNLDVPRALIAQETDSLRGQMFQQFGGMPSENIDLKALLPDEMFAERAERRVKLGLLLGEMIRSMEVQPDAARVRAEIEEIASTYQEPEEVVNWYYANQEQLAGVEAKVMEDLVVEQVLAAAQLNEQPCSYQEAIAQAQRGQA
jgi:trigger factor